MRIHIEEIGSHTLERAALLLHNVPGGVDKAIYNAMKRAESTGKNKGASYATAVYNLNVGQLRSHCSIKSSISGTTIYITYAGGSLPLTMFNPTGGQQGGVRVAVRRGPMKPLPHAWHGNGYGYGVWERVGSRRFPITQLFTIGTGGMMGASDVAEPFGQEIESVFATRLEHEITRLLNGW